MPTSIRDLRIGQTITPKHTILPARVLHWRYAPECGSIGGGLMPGAELTIAEISSFPEIWVRATIPGRTPVSYLKIAGEEFGGNFILLLSSDKAAFDSSIKALESEAAVIGSHILIDAAARDAYVAQIKKLSEDLTNKVNTGKITWSQAADEANEIRETTMNIIRARSTPVGRAMAESLKSEGPNLNTLVARKTTQLYGANVDFNRLSIDKQNAVYREIVRSAGKSSPRVTGGLRRLSLAGRTLILTSIGLSVYNIMTADDKVDAAGREIAVTGGGVAGGFAGGALAGLACGPGAPVCVTIGAFVGGAIVAFGADLAW